MISIVIPTYNRASILPRVLDSFKQQSFSNWECIVVDDYSLDDIKTIVNKYSQEDKRFKYVLNCHLKGAQGARNSGVEVAIGEWIAFFDSDDYAYPDFLAELSNKISDDIDVVTSNAKAINVNDYQQNKIMNWSVDGHILQKLLSAKCYVGYNGTLIRKSALIKIRLLDEKCPSMQEFDTHIRLAKNKFTYASTNLILSDYFVGGGDTISINRERYVDGLSYVLKKHQWTWRLVAYRSFIFHIKKVWFCAMNLQSNKYKYILRIVLIAPEFILFLLKKYMCNLLK